MGLPWVQPVAAGAPAGAQPWYMADWLQSPFNCSWSLKGLGGGVTGTYAVEVTMDDPNIVASPKVFDVVAGQTADAFGNVAAPVLAMRVNFGTGPVGGGVVFRVVQGMTSR